MIDAGADIYEKIPDGRSALDLCDDPELRSSMMEHREQSIIRNQEKAALAAAAAAQQQQQKITTRLAVNTNLLPNGQTSRTGTLYESRSSVSSPYGSGSSLNRTSSIRRASIREREKVKKLNENFLDVLQAKDEIPEDTDEGTSTKIPSKEEQTSTVTTATESTIREPSTKKSPAPIAELTLPPLKVLPPLPPPADTLSDVKRRREERRRGIGGSSSSTLPPVLTENSMIKTNDKNNNHLNAKIITSTDPLQRYTSPKHIEIKDYHVTDDDREKRICCTIL